MSDLRETLKIPASNLEAVNSVLLDPNSRVVNAFLEVVARYGTPEEINRKHRESCRMEALFEKIRQKAPQYLDDLYWLIDQ